MTRTVWIRLTGLAFVASTGWYLPWVLRSLDTGRLWLGIPFVLATMLIIAGALLALINNWQRTSPPPRPVQPGTEPLIAVIVTSAGEDPVLIERTARSVLVQSWPDDRTWLIISDDGGDPALGDLVRRLAGEYPLARVQYNRPPPRGTPERRGQAKAGNLNSALSLVASDPDPPLYLETRDADDVVRDPEFLRQAVGQLTSDPRVAFVQTMKTTEASEGDPFANEGVSFFRGSMFGRNAANAVFPCGSGLVWRIRALEDIGGFPTWNLVEDLQSGVEVLRRGWRGCYLPVLGAHGQHAPEDIPNVYKQRGTWALDTMRLLLWGDLRGLSLRQRLQFWELGLFYLQSFAILTVVLAAIVGLLLDAYPLEATWPSHTLHFWPFAASLEALLAAMFARGTMEAYLGEREMWIGLSPVFAKACVLAVVRGRRGGPSYRVTRKHNEFGWYWRETLPQAILVGGLLLGIAASLVTRSPIHDIDLATVYWATLFAGFLAAFVSKSWFGAPSPLAQLLNRRPHGRRDSEEAGAAQPDPASELAEPPQAVTSASQAGLGE
jgi:cellulose synthase (UDP-forming)